MNSQSLVEEEYLATNAKLQEATVEMVNVNIHDRIGSMINNANKESNYSQFVSKYHEHELHLSECDDWNFNLKDSKKRNLKKGKHTNVHNMKLCL